VEASEQLIPIRSTQSADAEISTAAVQILRAHTGRGPTKARTHISGDLVTIVMGGTLTRAERMLVDQGQWPRVEDLRQEMQRIMKDELVAAVEQHTGRRVIAFVSANHCEPDLAIENFVLAPAE
jgi:uncharacterized protein YbcI